MIKYRTGNEIFLTLFQSENVRRGVQTPVWAVQPGETGRNNTVFSSNIPL
jgi:hypothetical protein